MACAGFALAVSVTGCAGTATAPGPGGAPPPSSAPPRSPFPSRPVELRLDAVDPCALLSSSQQQQLGLHQQSLTASADPLGGKDCAWGNSDAPENGYSARTITGHGAEYALGSTTGTQLVEVGGFGAVATAGAYTDPNYQCVVVIDVAPGQSLYAEYGNDNKDYPGMTHQLACQKATALGVTMLQNLRTLVR